MKLKASEKLKVVKQYKFDKICIKTLSEMYNVSRSTIYGVLKTYEKFGVLKFVEQSKLEANTVTFEDLSK
jgi:transposase